MGSTSTLLLLDTADLRRRVLPALRDWVAGGDPAPWWLDLLSGYQPDRPAPDPNDRAAWPGMLDPTRQPVAVHPADGSLVPLPDRALAEETRSAVELAVLTATVGDGLAFGNSRWLALDLLDDEEPVLDPVPAPESALGVLLDRLDMGLRHVNAGGGGYGEGLRGILEPSDAAELDRLLTFYCKPVQGSVREILDATDAIGGVPEHIRQAQGSRLALHAMAHKAGQAGLGLLHGRDLSLNSLGEWDHGVFVRRAST